MLVLDGVAIGDSTRIIEALERSHPDPPLYPADPGARRRALELEDFFDEELGPYTRLLVLNGVLPDAGLTLGTFAPDLSRGRRELQPSGYLVGESFTVADLTLAALVAPAVAPEQFPYPQPQREHPRLAELRAGLAEEGLADWARAIYARHRGASAEIGR